MDIYAIIDAHNGKLLALAQGVDTAKKSAQLYTETDDRDSVEWAHDDGVWRLYIWGEHVVSVAAPDIIVRPTGRFHRICR